MEAIVARRFVDQAHPVSPIPRSDWRPPRSHRRPQYPIAVAVECVLLGAGFVVVLAALGVVAAVLGVDAGVPR